MDLVTGILASKAIQGVSGLVTKALDSSTSENSGAETQTAEKSNDFEQVLMKMLPSNQGAKVSEEELFAALLYQRISQLKGGEEGEKFKGFLEDFKNKLKRSDGYVPVENAANKALDKMVQEGILTQEEKGDIYKVAFAGAQLDDNLNALYDGRGSADDPTVATADLESALIGAKAIIDSIDSGEVSLDDLNGNKESGNAGDMVVPTDDNKIDGENGFLFKPESDHGKKLVILVPPDISGDISSVLLKDSEGNVIEEGRSSGIANGGREHFRFSQPGSSYPKELIVQITLNDGSVREILIPDPSKRYD